MLRANFALAVIFVFAAIEFIALALGGPKALLYPPAAVVFLIGAGVQIFLSSLVVELIWTSDIVSLFVPDLGIWFWVGSLIFRY